MHYWFYFSGSKNKTEKEILNDKNERYIDIQLIVWIGFMMVDWIEEKIHIDMRWEMCLCFSIVVTILYFIKRLYDWNNRQKRMPIRKRMKRFGVLIKRWYPITISITITTTVLAMNNTWIIPQCQIGLDSMLNGIEYAILGFFLIIIPTVTVFVGESMIWIFGKSSILLKK